MIQQAVARVIEITPDHGHRHQGRYHRQEQQGAEQALAADQPVIDQQRRAQRQTGRERPAHSHEIQRVLERRPEQRIAQQAAVIVQPDEAQAIRPGQRVEIEIGKAQQQRSRDRREKEHADDRQRGREKPDGGVDAAPRAHGADAAGKDRSSSQRRLARIWSTSRSSAVRASASLSRPRTASSA